MYKNIVGSIKLIVSKQERESESSNKIMKYKIDKDILFYNINLNKFSNPKYLNYDKETMKHFKIE